MVVELCEEDNDWVRDTVSVRVGRVRVAVEVTEGVTVRDSVWVIPVGATVSDTVGVGVAATDCIKGVTERVDVVVGLMVILGVIDTVDDREIE